MKLIFATHNQDKMREIRQIMADTAYEVLSMSEAGTFLEADETGTTFEENALIKARAVAQLAPDAVVWADDSGLEVDALDKAPGIYSSRFMGEDTPYPQKNGYILEKLKDTPWEARTARFVCAVAAVFPDGKEEVVRRTMEGHIGYEIAGENGFGYDPIFIPDGYEVTSATLSPDQKNAISHRGKALREMRRRMMGEEETLCEF